MLLNEFLKEHRQVEEQKCKLESLEKGVAELQSANETMRATLKEQAAQIQKVSDQLRTRGPAPRVVGNN